MSQVGILGERDQGQDVRTNNGNQTSTIISFLFPLLKFIFKI